MRASQIPIAALVPLLLVTGLRVVAAEQAESGDWSWKRLVMPGELSRAHADLAGDCSQCHTAFDLADEARRCLVCHEDVANDLAAGTGHHGRAPGRVGEDCRSCHTEHRGAEFDILGLQPASFDHSLTDFALLGPHAAQLCESCHASGDAYRDAPSDCVDCHAEDDAHGGTLGRDCVSCHRVSLERGAKGWATARFDHDETRFPLTGGHVDVACGLCHSGADYTAAPTECASCHRLDDAHQGAFGSDCASCHDTRSWARSGFDHEAVSGFALAGRHAAAECRSCHVEPPGHATLPKDCGSCHRLDDAHRGAYGADCERCHESRAWAPSTFDHEKATEFTLVGAHERLECSTCHTRTLAEPALETACIGCHRGDDPHASQLGRACGDCHTQQTFVSDVFFDHDLTRFPLLGLHAQATCEDCHATPRFRDAEALCESCHTADDIHEGSLGDGCARCHNPNGWPIWRFDHDAQTDFALHGRHADLSCASCHLPGRAGPESSGACESCHARDDAHRGSFGRDCGLCHGDEAWRPARLGAPGRGATDSTRGERVPRDGR